MNPALRLAACGKRPELAHPGAIENGLGHDRASRISGAKKQHVVRFSMGIVTHFASSEHTADLTDRRLLARR